MEKYRIQNRISLIRKRKSKEIKKRQHGIEKRQANKKNRKDIIESDKIEKIKE